MNPTLTRLAGLALLGAALTTPALADSASSASSAGSSASLGSLSDSVTGSSRSSSPKQVADGDYRVIEVAEVSQRPDMLRLQLQALNAGDGEGPLWLTLPRQALAPHALVAGDIVSARQRPYGVEFARGALRAPERQAFFLALADEWVGEIAARALPL